MFQAYKVDPSSTDSNYHPIFGSARWMLAIDSSFCFGAHPRATHGRKEVAIGMFMLDSLSGSLQLLVPLF